MPELRFVDGISELEPTAWDRLAAGRSPFLEWSFLAAIEAHSAVPAQGFLPRHLTAWEDGHLVGACPLYLKADGRAEFIYDWTWAMLAQRFGRPYYPKGVAMSPITPATAPRLLVAPGREPGPLQRLMVREVEAEALRLGLRGLHWLFLEEDEATLLEGLGYLRRDSAQLCLQNPGWTSVDDYLAGFRAKHRIKLRREMRRLAEQGLTVETLCGDELGDEHLEDMFSFWSDTCLRHGTGSDYLKRGSWELLFRNWRERLLVCFALRDGRRVAGSLCVLGDEELHGRYWGAAEDWPSLYFNLAFFAPLRVMIERGLHRFHAGFGNAPHKQARGFAPLRTLSAHRLFDAELHSVLSEISGRERELVSADLELATRHSRLAGTGKHRDPREPGPTE